MQPSVIWNCTSPTHAHDAVIRPNSIAIACAGGIGVDDLVWTTWTPTAATGTGQLWEDECGPNADGAVNHYSADITLSGVVNSSGGPVFARLTATYHRAAPQGHASDQFGLPVPGKGSGVIRECPPQGQGSTRPGVIWDCMHPDPQGLGLDTVIEPRSITIACADGGVGVDQLAWTSWTKAGAVGTGRVWENDCVPNCATGTVGHYFADISLSRTADSTEGPIFTELTARYHGAGPQGHTSDQFQLPLPPKEQ